MAKLTSIAKADRVQERIEQRDPDEATDELRGCITAMNLSLETLAKEYPGSMGLGAIVNGSHCGVLVLSRSAEFIHCSPVAMERARTLAQVIACLPDELAEVFRIELNLARERSKLLEQMEQARAAALAATEEERT